MAVCRVCTTCSPRAGSHPYLLVQGVKVRGSRRSEPVRMLCENMTGQVKENTKFYKHYQHFCDLKSSFCSGIFIPDSNFSIPDPGSKSTGSQIRNREFKYFQPQKMQCCGSGMFIPDPGSDFFPSRIRNVSIPDPGSSSKNLSILTPK
jgi:hypothetical protein